MEAAYPTSSISARTTPTTTPRPILKRTYSTPEHRQRGVHFPPSPILTRTFATHSSATYDRSAIVVSQNACALPARGCRQYQPSDAIRRFSSTKGRSLHPRAVNAFQDIDEEDAVDDGMPRSYPHPPSLIPDLSSESEESDGFISPQPHPLNPMAPVPSIADSSMDTLSMSFLPHKGLESPRRTPPRKSRERERPTEASHFKAFSDKSRFTAPDRTTYCSSVSNFEPCLGGF